MMKEMQLDEMMLVNGGSNNRMAADGGGSGGKIPVDKVVKDSGGKMTERMGTDMRGGGGMPRTNPLANN